jgi:hypothetical protein
MKLEKILNKLFFHKTAIGFLLAPIFISCANPFFIKRDTVHTDCLDNETIYSGAIFAPLPYKKRTFFKVLKIEGGSLWQESGYKKGDVIYKVNGRHSDNKKFLEDNLEAFCWRGSKIEILRKKERILCRPVEGCVEVIGKVKKSKVKKSNYMKDFIKKREKPSKFNRPKNYEVEIR